MSQIQLKAAARYTQQRSSRLILLSTKVGQNHGLLPYCETRPTLIQRNDRIERPDIAQKRFLITELLQALASPFDTIRQIKNTKKMLEDAKEEFMEQYELSKVPRVNTFQPFPDFYKRARETRAIQKALITQPSFLVVFGGSSVGKTALLRKILSGDTTPIDLTNKRADLVEYVEYEADLHPSTIKKDGQKYIVMHIDMRIAGFADMNGLAIRLASQFEQFFETISNSPEEDGILKTEQECQEQDINHERINAQYAAQYKDAFKGHMMAFRQLRKQFQARMEKSISTIGTTGQVVTIGDISNIMERFQSSLYAYWQFEVNTEEAKSASELQKAQEAEQRQRIGFLKKSKNRNGLVDIKAQQELDELERRLRILKENMNRRHKSPMADSKKRLPVILIDEAHRLPALVESQDCIKTLLDSFLVLTKQDRLCHVIHTTSDPFYLHWLRAFNIAQHTKIITIKDCTYQEAHDYFYTSLLPSTIEKLPSPGLIKQRLPQFEDIWEVFGGRIAHMADYISEFIYSDGTISPQQSSHFTQAYNNVKFHLTHHAFVTHSSIPDTIFRESEFDSKVFKLIIQDLLASRDATQDTSKPLLPKYSLDYFDICEKYGAEKVNAIVSSRLLDISWSPAAAESFELSEDTNGPTLPPPKPASSLGEVTPPKLHAMSRVIEKALELVFLAKPS